MKLIFIVGSTCVKGAEGLKCGGNRHIIILFGTVFDKEAICMGLLN